MGMEHSIVCGQQPKTGHWAPSSIVSCKRALRCSNVPTSNLIVMLEQERRLKTLGLLDDDGGSTYDAFFKDGVA